MLYLTYEQMIEPNTTYYLWTLRCTPLHLFSVYCVRVCFCLLPDMVLRDDLPVQEGETEDC
jgi:hypothetical protein